MIWIGFILVNVSHNVKNPTMGASMLVVGLLGAFVGSLMISFPSTKPKPPVEPEVPAEEPKPRMRRTPMGITVVNNITGAVFQYRSKNNFGLYWYVDKEVTKVLQMRSERKDTAEDKKIGAWETLALLPNYSVTSVDWEVTEQPNQPLTDSE